MKNEKFNLHYSGRQRNSGKLTTKKGLCQNKMSVTVAYCCETKGTLKCVGPSLYHSYRECFSWLSGHNIFTPFEVILQNVIGSGRNAK